jgi:hypothetical protein
MPEAGVSSVVRRVKDLSIPVHDCPNGGVSLDRD